MFNPNDYLNATVAAPMSTQIAPIPEGEWTAMVDDSDKFADVRQVNTPSGPRPIATVWFKILDDKCRALANRDSLRVRYDIWIDETASGVIDTSPGKNVKLGQLRDALGQNTPNQNWSFAQLRGAGPVIVKTVQEPNEKDPENPYSKVARVLKAA